MDSFTNYCCLPRKPKLLNKRVCIVATGKNLLFFYTAKLKPNENRRQHDKKKATMSATPASQNPIVCIVLGQPITIERLLLCDKVRRMAGLSATWDAFHAERSGNAPDVHDYLQRYGPTHLHFEKLQSAVRRITGDLLSLVANFDTRLGADLTSGDLVLALTGVDDEWWKRCPGPIVATACSKSDLNRVATLLANRSEEFALHAQTLGCLPWQSGEAQTFEPRILPFSLHI